MPLLRAFVLVLTLALSGAPRDFEAMERRRKQAARLFRRGKSQSDVARELGVSRQSASRWHAEWSEGGADALRGAGRAGLLNDFPSSTKTTFDASSDDFPKDRSPTATRPTCGRCSAWPR